MKTITFFSEKGGVGKSSLSMMFASVLNYKYGRKVALVDFNHRIVKYRRTEIKNRLNYIKNNPNTDVKQFDVEKAWPIFEVVEAEARALKQNGYVQPYAEWFRRLVKKEDLGQYDIVVCDYPGAISEHGAFLDMLQHKQLGIVVIPTEKDEMTLDSTLRLHSLLKDYNHCCFINKAQLGLKNYRNAYLTLGTKLMKLGIPMLPDIITYSERMTTIDKVDIIRSTFGFPDFSKPEYAAVSDLGLENLFIDITRELNKTPDMENTPEVDLSFADSLKKTDDGRYFRGSSYPQYEL